MNHYIWANTRQFRRIKYDFLCHADDESFASWVGDNSHAIRPLHVAHEYPEYEVTCLQCLARLSSAGETVVVTWC